MIRIKKTKPTMPIEGLNDKERRLVSIEALLAIDNLVFLSIGLTVAGIDRYGALSLYLEKYDPDKYPDMPRFFRLAASMAVNFNFYVYHPSQFNLNGHLENADIIKKLINGEYGFSLSHFFDDDQIAIIPKYLDWVENPDYTNPVNDSKSHSPKEGNVYLMKNKRNGYYKIGFTSGEPEFREATLQSQEPEIDLIWHTWKDMGFEKRLHEMFADKRLRGEWFDLDENDIKQIIKVAER